MHRKILKTLTAAALIGSMLTVPAFAENAVVVGSDVNLRAGPGAGYRVVDCLPEGTEVSVTNRSNSAWYAVEFGGQTGFMSSAYLQIAEEKHNVDVSAGSGSAYVNASCVRMRSGPGSEYAVLGEYNYGKEIRTTGTAGAWTACTVDGVSGYIYSDYISGSKPASTAIEALPSSQYDEYAGYGSAPSKNTTAIQPLPTTVPVATSAPAADPYLGQSKPQTTPAPTAAPAPTKKPGTVTVVPLIPVTTPSPTNTPTKVTVGTAIPVATAAPTATPKPAETPKTVTVPVATAKPAPSTAPTATPAPTAAPQSGSVKGTINGNYVRFRTGPATSYSIIDSYDKGKAIEITGTYGEWTACIIDGVSGYVFSQYVLKEQTAVPTATPAPSATPTPTETPAATQAPVTTPTEMKDGYITGNNVRMRSAPSMTSEIMGELFYGNAVKITGISGDWTAVIYGEYTGYVYSTYVKEGSLSLKNETETEKPSTGNTQNNSGVTGSDVANFALQFVGTNYTWGGKSPETGFDCSGLVYYSYQHFGYELNRVAADQAMNGVHVDVLQPGDILCFYSGGSYIGHSGIYIGDGKFVHAANSATGVIVTELSGYYSSRGYEARRIIN